jgi:hypothetical protein
MHSHRYFVSVSELSAGDIRYIWTGEGWVYLAVILDLHSRRVIALRDLHANPTRVKAWAISNRLKKDLAIRALNLLMVCDANHCRAVDGDRPASTAQRVHPPHPLSGSCFA